MMKLRAWIKELNRFADGCELCSDGSWGYDYDDVSEELGPHNVGSLPGDGDFLNYCVGLTDVDGVKMYHKDICEFDNGDRFVIEKEDWLEFYASWIGEPECEDQTRDFYRIRNAKVIGNIHENPELLEKST